MAIAAERAAAVEKSPDAFRTISEVAAWLQTPAHVLRFWESRFPQVAPVKRAGGRRYYRPEDMRLLGGIKQLLHGDGHTIKSVQDRLNSGGVAAVAALSPPLAGDGGNGEDRPGRARAKIPDAKASSAKRGRGSAARTKGAGGADPTPDDVGPALAARFAGNGSGAPSRADGFAEPGVASDGQGHFRFDTGAPGSASSPPAASVAPPRSGIATATGRDDGRIADAEPPGAPPDTGADADAGASPSPQTGCDAAGGQDGDGHTGSPGPQMRSAAGPAAATGSTAQGAAQAIAVEPSAQLHAEEGADAGTTAMDAQSAAPPETSSPHADTSASDAPAAQTRGAEDGGGPAVPHPEAAGAGTADCGRAPGNAAGSKAKAEHVTGRTGGDGGAVRNSPPEAEDVVEKANHDGLPGQPVTVAAQLRGLAGARLAHGQAGELLWRLKALRDRMGEG